jgi:flagellar protein FlaG
VPGAPPEPDFIPVAGSGKSLPPSPVDEAARSQAEQQFKAFMSSHDQSVRFQVDQQTGITIVHVYNTVTGEVIRQIPTEEVVRIAQYLDTHAARIDVTA